MSEKDKEMMFYIFYNMYLQYICNYHYRRKSHKAKFLLFHSLCFELHNHSQFFLSATFFISSLLSRKKVSS